MHAFQSPNGASCFAFQSTKNCDLSCLQLHHFAFSQSELLVLQYVLAHCCVSALQPVRAVPRLGSGACAA